MIPPNAASGRVFLSHFHHPPYFHSSKSIHNTTFMTTRFEPGRLSAILYPEKKRANHASDRGFLTHRPPRPVTVPRHA